MSPIATRPSPQGAATPITVASPQFGPEIEAAVVAVLRGGQLAQGRAVEQFEACCREMAGTRHAVAVANGTVSLEMAIEALGFGPGDEIITTPFTFAATVNSVVRAGVRARLVDIRDDFTIDPASVAAAINPRTVAVMPVHLFGLPADMDAIGALAAAHGLAVIEDAAQAHGAEVGGRRVGSFGVGSFSFYATKNIACGEGGVVTTDDQQLARELRVLRNQGMTELYEYERIGRNARLTEIQAAIGIPQLQDLENVIARRQANAGELHRLLDGAVAGVVLPGAGTGRRHVWHQYTVLVPPSRDRDAVVARMRERGVFPGVYYPRLLHEHAAYRDHELVVADDVERARNISRRCVSLPVRGDLTRAELQRVAEAFVEATNAVNA
jgi:perosamine synthetase